jgi:HSF-type DNA-binding
MHHPTRLETVQRRQEEEGYMMQTSPKITEVVSRVCASKQFPGKLHDLLSYAEHSGLEWIISWVHHGKAFMVHSQHHLLQIIPIFFGQTKFRSFQRQLNVSIKGKPEHKTSTL